MGFKIRAHAIGERVRATILEMTTAVDSVTANSKSRRPVIPPINARGRKTATRDSVVATTANAISYCGASPHFVDIGIDALGMSPTVLKSHLNEIAEQNLERLFGRKDRGTLHGDGDDR